MIRAVKTELALVVAAIVAMSALCAYYRSQIVTLSETAYALQKRLGEQASECGEILGTHHQARSACVDTCMTALDYETPDQPVSYTCMRPYCDSQGNKNGYTCAFECTLTNLRKGSITAVSKR